MSKSICQHCDYNSGWVSDAVYGFVACAECNDDLSKPKPKTGFPALIRGLLALPAQLTRIERLIQTTLERINTMATTVAEVLARVADLKSQVGSIGDQIVAKVTDLQAKIDAGQDASAEMAALNDLGASLQKVDDLVPDLPKTPPAEPTPAAPPTPAE